MFGVLAPALTYHTAILLLIVVVHVFAIIIFKAIVFALSVVLRPLEIRREKSADTAGILI